MEWFIPNFIYFVIYAFIGWVCETGYCAFREGKLINRGFLNGPFCPVYAAGALSIIYLLRYFYENMFLIFLYGMIITTLIEYLTGWLLETIFRTRWWDYSDRKFQLRGRVCLENSLLFGALSVLLIRVVQPGTEMMVAGLPEGFKIWAVFVLAIYFTVDTGITVYTILGLNKRLKRINAILLLVKERLDTYGWRTSLNIRERLEEYLNLNNFDGENQFYKTVKGFKEGLRQLEKDNCLQRRLLRAFPNLKSIKYPEQLAYIRTQIAQARKKFHR